MFHKFAFFISVLLVAFNAYAESGVVNSSMPENYCRILFDTQTAAPYCTGVGICTCIREPDQESPCCRFLNGGWKCGKTGDTASMRCRPCLNMAGCGTVVPNNYEGKASTSACTPQKPAKSGDDDFPDPCVATMNTENPTAFPTCSGKCQRGKPTSGCRFKTEFCCVGRTDTDPTEDSWDCGPGITCTCD